MAISTTDTKGLGSTTNLLVLFACLFSVATATETQQATATTSTTANNLRPRKYPATSPHQEKETDWSARTTRLLFGSKPRPWTLGEFGKTLTE